MNFKGRREMKKPCYIVVYVILLCALEKGCSEGKRWKHDEFFRDHIGEKVSYKLFICNFD